MELAVCRIGGQPHCQMLDLLNICVQQLAEWICVYKEGTLPGVFGESVPGPTFFKIVMNDLDEGTEGMLSKLQKDTKLGVVLDVYELVDWGWGEAVATEKMGREGGGCIAAHR